ncbi:hypothetical protein SynWH8101_2770 [Synechococcus sp. WH 8101]|uniref:hypothetical protein n=1 Tax=Synechococcus sp. WH 8101 TaxID=59932 RepID=UPI0010247B5B|nr:hypothetical protein [Synechococcus sp. WH 8101]QBE70335.1 hypothetical protein SynWH8101_2770 [Synechococcus sp. WH 8101]
MTTQPPAGALNLEKSLAVRSMAFQLKEFFAPWLNSTAEKRAFFLSHPREAMEEIVGVPSDIQITITQNNQQIWFRASIPKMTNNTAGSLGHMRQNNQRILKCPVLKVSGTEFIQNHESILMDYGIRVPDDVIVSIDNDAQGMIHFDVRLDTLYS